MRQAKAGSAKKARRKAAKGKDAELVPHYAVLACEYHVSIVAGLSLIGTEEGHLCVVAGRSLIVNMYVMGPL